MRGYSYRFNYAKHFESTGSQITFAGYRFSDKNYVSMNEYLNSRNGDESIDNEKESYVISLNQYFETLELNSYLNITRNTYWDSPSNTNYSISVSKNFDIGDFKGISASLAVSRIRWDDDEENQYYFSFSLPLQQSRNISYSMQRTDGSNTSQMISGMTRRIATMSGIFLRQQRTTIFAMANQRCAATTSTIHHGAV